MAKLCNDSNHVPFIHLLRKENRKLHRMLSNVQARNVTLENKLKLVENLLKAKRSEILKGHEPKGRIEAQKMTSEQLINAYGTKSNAIRALSAMGLQDTQIVAKLNISQQHVWQAVNTPLKPKRMV